MIFASINPRTQQWDLDPEVYAKVTGNVPTPIAPRAHEPNVILIDARFYQEERSRMNNPKGRCHVLRRVEGAINANPWNASADEIEHAVRVLQRWVAVFGPN